MHVPALPTGQAFFCDDIRQEIGNKITLVGIYSGTMEFASDVQFPIIISKLCIAIYWHEPIDTTVKEIAFRVFLADGEAAPHSENDLLMAESIIAIPHTDVAPEMSEATRSATVKTIGTFMVLSPLPIEKPGKLRVRVFRDGDPWMAGSLRILKTSEPAPTD